LNAASIASIDRIFVPVIARFAIIDEHIAAQLHLQAIRATSVCARNVAVVAELATL